MTRHLVFPTSLLFILFMSACSQNVSQSAATGAAGGAAASALGSLVVGLIFNDQNTAERVARSAVYGATVGAAAGAAAGASKDAQEAQTKNSDSNEKPDIRNMSEEEFLKAVGPYNFSATLALRDCNYEEAKSQTLKAFQSDNRDYREASLWLQAVIATETGDKGALKNLHQQLAAYNPELGQPDKAKAGLDLLLEILHEDREQHGLLPTCQ
jgi:hypothetical protein